MIAVASVRAGLLALAMVALSGCAAVIERDAVPAQLSATATVPGLEHARFWGDEVPPNLPEFIKTYLPNVGRLAVSTCSEAKGRPVVEYLAKWVSLSLT